MIRAIILDADDTLWETELLYQRALDLTQFEVERHDIDGDAWRKLQLQLDLEAVKTAAFDIDRFPSSSARAYKELAPRYDAEVEQRVYDLTSTVFRSEARLFPETSGVLERLVGHYRLAVITKGDVEIQHKRLDHSGLAHRFDSISIVETKRPETFGSMCDLLAVHPSEAVSVGNSLASDVLPAIEAGLSGIWIDAPVWAHERRAAESVPSEVIKLASLSELPDAVGNLS